MKRRLNILCAVVLLVMGWSVGVSLYYMGLGMTKGVQMGMDAAREIQEGRSYDKLQQVNNLRNISLFPKFLKAHKGDIFTDSVRNEKTGQYVPMAYTNLMVSVPVEKPVWQNVVSGGHGYACFGVRCLGIGVVHPHCGGGQPFGYFQLAKCASLAPSGHFADSGFCLCPPARVFVAL